MPVLDGYQALSAMQARGCHIPDLTKPIHNVDAMSRPQVLKRLKSASETKLGAVLCDIIFDSAEIS